MAMQRNIAIKNAIKSADFRPKLLPAQKDSVREMTLGTLLGLVKGIKYQADAKDATVILEGLAGQFRFVPADGIEGDILQSSTLWIPDSARDLYHPTLKEAEGYTNEETGEVVEPRAIVMDMALTVNVIRANNAAGYTWKFIPLIQPKANDPTDPFTALTDRIGGAKAIADQTKKVEGAEQDETKAPEVSDEAAKEAAASAQTVDKGKAGAKR